MNSPLRRIRLTSSGGLANLALGGEASDSLRSEDLPTELVERLEAILDRSVLGAADGPGASDSSSKDQSQMASPGLPLPFGAADTLQYELTLETEDGKIRRFEFDEASVPPEVLDLLDDLKAALRTHPADPGEHE